MEEIGTAVCSHCAQEQIVNFKFCSACGTRNTTIIAKEQQSEILYKKNLNRLSVYAVLIVSLIIFTALTEFTLEVFVGLTITFAVIDVVFSLLQPSVWKLVNFKDVRVIPVVSTIAIGACSGIIVSYSMDKLNLLLFEETNSYMYLFYNLENPLWGAIIIMAIFPAIFEELAFRGFIFNNLQVIGGEKSAIYGSTFLFALVHLSLLSFVWIIPFGLLLAYFRNKYSTLIYGMIGHFVHNATVVLVEYYNVFG